jgi:hypothetical protein
MPRNVYDPKDKVAIFKAVRETLRSGKSWEDAFEAAKSLNYAGTKTSLQKMFYARKKPGRKKGQKYSAPRIGVAAAAGDLGDLKAALDKMVKERVRAALDHAVAVLQRSRDEA